MGDSPLLFLKNRDISGRKMHVPKPFCKKGYWYVRVHGRDYYLGKDRKEAVKVADQIILKKLYQPSGSVKGYSISDSISIYIQSIEKNVANRSLKNYVSTANQVGKLIGNRHLNEFSKLDFARFLDSLVKGGKSLNTIKCYRNVLLASIKYAESRNLCKEGTWHSFQTVPIPRNAKRPKRVKPIDISALDAVKDLLGQTVYDVLRLEYLTGMRPNELLRLRKCDFIKDPSGVWKVIFEDHKTVWKTGEPLVKFIGPRAQEILSVYISKVKSLTDPLFVTRTGKPFTVNYLATKIWKEKRNHPDKFPEHFNQYQCRHKAGTDARHEAGLEGAQAFLGHACRATSEIYSEVDHSLAVEVALRIG